MCDFRPSGMFLHVVEIKIYCKRYYCKVNKVWAGGSKSCIFNSRYGGVTYKIIPTPGKQKSVYKNIKISFPFAPEHFPFAQIITKSSCF